MVELVELHAEQRAGDSPVYDNLAVLVCKVGDRARIRAKSEESPCEHEQEYEDRDDHRGFHLASRALLPDLAVARHVDDDGGGVVVAARAVRFAHKRARAALRIGDASEDALDCIVFEHGGESVGADEQPVARFDVQLVEVGGHMRIAAERAGDNRAVRMVSRFFGGELPRFDHIGHEAVVARELLELSLMEQICARIAHLGEHETFAFEYGGRHGAAHALPPDTVFHAADDGAVRFRHGKAERFAIGAVGGVFRQGINCDFRSDLACGVASHAVGDGEQGRCDDEAVLVVVAHAPDVGAAAEGGGGMRFGGH